MDNQNFNENENRELNNAKKLVGIFFLALFIAVVTVVMICL